MLSGSNDFEAWYDVIKRRARTLGVWKYVNPEANPPVAFEEPPDQPTANGQTALTLWQEKRKDYTETRKALGKLEDHITETLDSKLLRTLRNTDTVAAQLKVLFNLYNQPLVSKIDEARRNYYRARKYTAQRQSLEDWCNDFQLAYNEALSLKVPEVQGYTAQEDLIQVFYTINPPYAALLHMNLSSAKDDYAAALMNTESSPPISFPSRTVGNTPGSSPSTTIPEEYSVQTLIRKFLRASHLNVKSSRVSHSAFGATHNGNPSPYPRKRPISNKKGEKKSNCPCCFGKSHGGYWGESPYLVPSKRPAGWTADPTITKRVNDWIAESPEKRNDIIASLCNRAMRQRQTSKRAKIGSSNESGLEYIDTGNQDSPQHSDNESAEPIKGKARGSVAAVYHANAGKGSDPGDPLLHSWTLDNAADIHVCNNPAEFIWKKPASHDDFVRAGGSISEIEAWGECDISVQTTRVKSA